jgi:hypothetical protein
MMSNTDLQARVREALERTDVMALSTVDDDGGPWTSPVQYQSDSQLNLYFTSMPDARHVRNIQRDARVAVAISNMPGPPGGNLGLQIRGHAVAMAPGSGRDGWQRFTIEPAEAWCFDSRVDRQRHRVEVPSLDQDAGLTSQTASPDQPTPSLARHCESRPEASSTPRRSQSAGFNRACEDSSQHPSARGCEPRTWTISAPAASVFRSRPSVRQGFGKKLRFW